MDRLWRAINIVTGIYLLWIVWPGTLPLTTTELGLSVFCALAAVLLILPEEWSLLMFLHVLFAVPVCWIWVARTMRRRRSAGASLV